MREPLELTAQDDGPTVYRLWSDLGTLTTEPAPAGVCHAKRRLPANAAVVSAPGTGMATVIERWATPFRRTAWLGHFPVEHLRTYVHVVLERSEIDLETVLERDRIVIPR